VNPTRIFAVVLQELHRESHGAHGDPEGEGCPTKGYGPPIAPSDDSVFHDGFLPLTGRTFFRFDSVD
jgi:hypothetical protein